MKQKPSKVYIKNLKNLKTCQGVHRGTASVPFAPRFHKYAIKCQGRNDGFLSDCNWLGKEYPNVNEDPF